MAKLTASDGSSLDHFGRCAGIHGDAAVVGATGEDHIFPDSGAAYLFRRDAGGASQWGEAAKLIASDGEALQVFGRSSAVHAETILVGSLGAPFGCGDGAGYLYLICDTGSVYCAGDGSGAACPCANPGAPESGCANGTFAQGCSLSACGAASVGSDAMVLYARNATPDQSILFFQGDNQINAGDGLPFGDGLRCAGGSVSRLEIITADGGGYGTTTVPIAQSGNVSPGDTRYYQCWYREPVGGPCGTGFNLSNGLELLWAP